jgi:7-cyano-7-deazaguanine synthase
MRRFSPKHAIDIPTKLPRTAIAVLASGGIQSAILTAHLLDEFEAVYPVYVRIGSSLERAEEQQLRRFLAAIRGPRLGRLTIIESSQAAEDGDRLEQLLSRAAAWCASNGIESLAVGTLDQIEVSLPEQTGKVRVISPFAALSRSSVLELGQDLPLDFTFSCSRPVIKALSAKHCGQCLKCQRRKLGLASLKLNDRTTYADAEKMALSAS